MAKEFDSVLQAKLEDHLIKANISASQLAKAIGISPTRLSQYRSSTYTGDIEVIERALREYFLNFEESARVYRAGEYVETSISKGVYQTIRLTHLQGGLSIEAGDAGIGKTMAAQKYVEDHPSAVYWCANTCTNSVSAFLKCFARLLNIEASGRKDDLWMRINDSLRGARKVLIIDESQHLPIKTVEAIRSFTDCNTNFGVCLIGNHETVQRKGLPGYAQIRNRTRVTIKRHVSNIKVDDIKLLFPEIDDRTAKFLHKVSMTEQGIRGVCNIYENAVANDNISYEGITACAKEFAELLI